MKSFNEVFQKVKDLVRTNTSETAASLWVEPLEFVNFEDNVITINCGEDFVKGIVLKNKYVDLWKTGFEDALGFPVTVNFIIIK